MIKCCISFCIKKILIAAVIIILCSAVSISAQTGVYTLSGGTATKTSETLTSSTTDVSAILVNNSGSLTLNTCIINTTGNSSSTDNSSKVGLNAAILANAAGKVIMSGGTITTSGSGANGLFATGSGSSISMSNGTITCTGGNAHGIDVTYTGTITLNNVTIKTSGASSSGVATDFGGGTINVTGGSVAVSGSKSAGIYSTGNITVTDASVTASGDNAAVIDADGIITLSNTSLTGYQHGLMVHNTVGQSSLVAVFTISGGSITANGGDVFYITGSKSTINVNNSALLSASTNNIVDAVSSSNVTFKANAVSLTGGFVTDATSTLSATLPNSSSLNGYVNNANTATLVTLTMDAASALNLTADSYVSVLTNSGGISGTSVTNITGNGHNIFYNSSLSGNSYLNGKTYSLINGGKLLPLGSSVAVEQKETLPVTFSLNQNYPNPFNPSTVISFTLAKESQVTLEVMNLLGQKIETLLTGKYSQGSYKAVWNAGNYSAGIYFYRLTISNSEGAGKNLIKKMILLK